MTLPLAPTMILPALATLHTCDAPRIREALWALREAYFPQALPVLKQSLSEAVRAVRPKRGAHPVMDDVPDSGYASAEEDDQEGARGIDQEEVEREDGLGMLCSDELERGYAIKWLTGLVKRGDAWVCGTDCVSSEEREARTTCLEDASRLLARFAGDDAPEEAVTRTFVFPLRVPPCGRCRWDGSSATPPITVELNDAPVDGTDHTAVGLQSWGSAIVFAERMCLDPEWYLGALHPCTLATTATARLLELGAGTGLLSMTAAQVFSRMAVKAMIKATDYHPNVLENLGSNVRHNPSALEVAVERLDWCAVASTGVYQNGEGVYDVVLAADVVYHPEHASWIRGCVERTLKRDGVFWLIIPVRTTGRHAGLGETVEEAFPVVGGREREGDEAERARLAIVRTEEVARVDGVGRADEGGYTLFEIRWAG